MAKTIKFNLKCDGNSIRTIEDLQHNFSIEDVLDYYKNGILERWLLVRGYNDELKAVQAITSHDPSKILKSLIKIFHIEDIDEENIEGSILARDYISERYKLFSRYERQHYQVDKILSDYFDQYNELVKNLVDCKRYQCAKLIVEKIADDYSKILNLDYKNLFAKLYCSKSFLAIMCLLANNKTRGYFLPTDKEIKGDIYQKLLTGKSYSDALYFSKVGTEQLITEKCAIYSAILQLVDDPSFTNALKGLLHTYSNKYDYATSEDNGRWKVVESEEKQYMIVKVKLGGSYSGRLRIENSKNRKKSDVSLFDIRGRFIKVRGIIYTTDHYYSSDEITYMEV